MEYIIGFIVGILFMAIPLWIRERRHVQVDMSDSVRPRTGRGIKAINPRARIL